MQYSEQPEQPEQPAEATDSQPSTGGPTVAQLTQQITNLIGKSDGVDNVDMSLAAMGIQSLAVLSVEELVRLVERLEGGN